MATPNPTTGVGVAAKILTTGNVNPTSTIPGKNGIILSLSGAGYPTTFQLNPVLADVAGTPVTTGTVTNLVLTAVAASSPGVLVLSAVAASTDGVHSVYTGTITGGTSNAWAGYQFTIAGFTNAANNGVFAVTASSTTTLTVISSAAVAETHAGTATGVEGTAVYTGTITGGGSNAFAGQDFTIAGFANAANNGTFLATASNTTTLTLQNSAAVAETHAGTATSEESGTNQLKYVIYPSKTLSGNTYQPSGTSVAVASISATGLITAVAKGHTEAEVSFPTFNNSVGLVVSSGNIMNGLPINKIYSSINVKVIV